MTVTAEFIKSIADIKAYKEFFLENPLSEVCIVGRSNVGKSTLINFLTGRKSLAKTSSTPGKTRLINLFEVCLKQDDIKKELVLVDLPGYGYAKASKGVIENFSSLIDDYFFVTKATLALVLLDIRHAPSKQDKQMLDYLINKNISFVIVATKLDKIAPSQIAKHKQMLKKELNLKTEILTTSSLNKKGKEEVLQMLFRNG